MYKVLFVCTGNICRSPAAEGALRSRVESLGISDKVLVDSAGTQGYHVGEAPDQRAVAAARKRGFSIEGLRARQVAPGDFNEFDLILGLDGGHVRHLKHMEPKQAKAHTGLFLEYAVGEAKEVPDPYYGESQHFEYMLDLIETGVTPLAEKLQRHLQ